MFGLSKIVLLAIALSTAQAAPMHTKRIAQVITAATQKWEAACVRELYNQRWGHLLTEPVFLQLAAGGGQKCNPISVTAFTTLLAAAGPCEQQNAADQMVDLAKGLKSDAQMIKLAQIFAQQPRNTVSVVRSTCPRFSFLHRLSAIFGERPVLPTGAQKLRVVGTVPMPIRRG